MHEIPRYTQLDRIREGKLKDFACSPILPSSAPWITSSVSRCTVLAYTTHADLRSFAGISLPTGYEGTPAAALPPLPDFKALKTIGSDGAWEESKVPGPSRFVRSLLNWHFYLPRAGALTPGVLDMWIRLASGECITQSALAYVAVSFPFNLHLFLAAPELRQLLESQQDPGETTEKQAQREELQEKNKQRAALLFPTVVMNLEAKTALPEEGVEWLAVRITSKQIKDGRFDLDMLIRDVEGEIVALSHHVAMILSVERNVGKRNFSGKAVL
ncbi:thioesterase-like superfamily-domain-containing protein [Daldinia loculata]|uniref:thioesterase-like superfamily-domain-containing protein n=1 Tax=Daldinia loculata TaxID=103429 RepID=UPI0020C234E6|nr:thioesterase-like superfamily-domain-containing protein [Daldinia loculata]KAI1644830.1 thioesterase-like superfamily-domain-containing protein [Daldinia loculata]